MPAQAPYFTHERVNQGGFTGMNMSVRRGMELFGPEYHSVYRPDELPNEVKFFNQQLMREFAPDITGYVLGFMIPPEFSAFPAQAKDEKFIDYFQKISCFAIMDIMPAAEQVTSDRVSNRSGGISFPIDVTPSEQVTITYIDNLNHDIYTFHHWWTLYIKESLEGFVEAPRQYLNYEDKENFGSLDYVGAIFVVKYDPSMTVVQSIGKGVGIYPVLMPNRETLGTRATNEMAMLSITYQCSWWYSSPVDDGQDKYGLYQQLKNTLTQYG